MLDVIPLTAPLTTLIQLSSVCFDSTAATQMNVSLYYDFINRDSVIFPLCAAHGLCGFPWTSLPRDPLPSSASRVGLDDLPGILEGQDTGDKM